MWRKKKTNKGDGITMNVDIRLGECAKLEEFVKYRIIPVKEKYPHMKIHIGVKI